MNLRLIFKKQEGGKTILETKKKNIRTNIESRNQFPREYAGEIYSSDFDTEGTIYSRSSNRRQSTSAEKLCLQKLYKKEIFKHM